MIPSSEGAERLRAPCSACMSTGQCWVCDGRGRYEVGPGIWRGCGPCSGTGNCPQCSATGPGPDGDTVITLTMPRQTTGTGGRD